MTTSTTDSASDDPQLRELKRLGLDYAYNADDPQWPGNAIDTFIKSLEHVKRLLPPGGVVRIDRGSRRGRGDKEQAMRICRVGASFPARYQRITITWPVPGEPQENWPTYLGPWKELPIINNPNL